MITIGQLLGQATINKKDARYILMSILDMDQTQLLTNLQMVLEPEYVKTFNKMAVCISNKMPLEYVINTAFFMGLTFYVNENVLIPRNDTEILAEAAIKHINTTNALTVLDMCTGSGCVLVSLLHYTEAVGVGVDISPSALDIAKKNAVKNNVGHKASFILSDMFSDIKQKFDLIVSNPPYIPTAHIPTLEHSVKAHEPHMALDGGADGLRFYHTLAKEAANFLEPNGTVFMEIGYDQGEAVKEICLKAGYDVTIKKDYGGHDRVVIAQMP
ncbi:MAG: peptide chain release factor N(5)-glutamine methyltransferase [Defluviitaleaceae bacterium]|nr:peptide chain release factor N(5)-glutamine methyltransferase [Defluviitaleaceae bacterium]